MTTTTRKLPVGPARDLLAKVREHEALGLTATKLAERTGWSYVIAEQRLRRAVVHGLASCALLSDGETHYWLTAAGEALL